MSNVISANFGGGFPKVVFPDSWDLLLESCGGMLTRLVDTDRGVKSAASDLFTKVALEQYRPPKDKFMLHTIGVASEQDYGFNKNADAFSREDLLEYHPTFLDGHMFREHLNQDPVHKIGDVKAAGYHPKLHRVELVLWGDREKAAKEYEKAKRGEPISVSMACKIKEDRCSIEDCRHLAKSPKDYCTHLKHSLGQYIPEKRAYAYAQNPRPRFFDISSVENPAERVARYLQYRFNDDGELQKAAASSGIIGGASWAEFYGYQPSGSSVLALTPARVAVFRKLAAVESWMRGLLQSGETPDEPRAKFAAAALGVWDTDALWSGENIQKASSCRPGTMFRELAKRAVFLPPASLMGYLMDQDPTVIQKSADCGGICGQLPNLFGGALEDIDATGGLDQVGHLCDSDSQLLSSLDGGYNDSVQQAMDSAISDFSVKEEPMTGRTMIVIIKNAGSKPELPPVPAASEGVRSATRIYAAYKAATYENVLAMNPDMDEDRLAILSVAQNMKLAMNAASA